MSCFAISARAFTRRAANSSLPIGLTSPVIDLRSAASSVARSAAATGSGRSAMATAAAIPIVNTLRRFMVSGLVRFVRFFFDDAGAEQRIDPLLDGRAFVVGDIYR